MYKYHINLLIMFLRLFLLPIGRLGRLLQPEANRTTRLPTLFCYYAVLAASLVTYLMCSQAFLCVYLPVSGRIQSILSGITSILNSPYNSFQTLQND